MARAIERRPQWGNLLRRTARVPRNKAAEQSGGRQAHHFLLAPGGLPGERDISCLLTPAQHPLIARPEKGDGLGDRSLSPLPYQG